MSHNHQKKLAVINDLSGFGRCSLSVALPIVSHLGVQCCPLPTAVFSNHTGFPSYSFVDLTDNMGAYMQEWQKLKLGFDAILTGFLGSARQIGLVEEFLKSFTSQHTTVIIDPVMGDNGRSYATYTPEMCREMGRLVSHADILTPNVTEACILTGIDYQPKLSSHQLEELAKQLCDQGPEKVVITGVPRGSLVENFCYQRDVGANVIRRRRISPQRSGTGDVFSAILSAGIVQDIPFDRCIRTAADFIRQCLIRSSQLDIPATDGVCFEELLAKLHF